MGNKGLTFLVFVGTLLSMAQAQTKGKLFIIGGGDRSSALVQAMVITAELRPTDYIVVLPMATSVPEESIAYISEQIQAHSTHKISSFNFTRQQADHESSWIDSVRNARMIYVTGGDQNKFMDIVRGTKLYDALHQAYREGATIAGTSAGAAIMSEVMITGAQKGEQEASSFREVKANYAETAQGMGFLTQAVIDQHFIMRSRYNRLLSVLADHPQKTVIGIDEGTAIVVQGKRAKVVGDSQVLVIEKPKKRKVGAGGKVSFENAKLSLFVHGQSFKL